MGGGRNTKLILAEKKVLAELIADAIEGRGTREQGCIRKGDYCITWASGHLLTLKEPEDYDPALKRWSLDTLPIFYDNWEVKPIPSDGRGKSAAERLQDIKALMDSSDCLIHAGDPDDEGQLLIDEIIRYFGYKKPVYRMNTGDTTAASLQASLANLSNNKSHESAGWAAYARSVADMTFGINLSRYFTLLNNPARLTVGRVQTPALNLVVAREEQIQSHTKTLYYTITVTVNVNGKLIQCKYEPNKDDPNLTDGKILSKEYAFDKAKQLRSMRFSSIIVTNREVKESPPLPFNLVRLQSYCGKQFGYSPSDTLAYSQRLRDEFNAITYNRTSCQYLSDNHFTEAPATMDTVVNNIHFRPKRMDMTIRSKCFDSSKIEAHHGIIPQDVKLDITKMDEPLRNLYLGVCKFYMAQFMPPAIKSKTKLEIGLPDGGKLTATSSVTLDEGYLSLFKKRGSDEDKEEEETTPLSELAPGTYVGNAVDAVVKEQETKPPSRYTQITLNEDMTRISKYVDDPYVKQLLLDKDKEKKDANGSIGTDATRAEIIKNLIVRGFMEEQGKSKHLVPTALGKELIRILPEEAKKPDITGYWWAIQDDIIHGKSSPEALTHNVRDMVVRIIHTDYPKISPEFLPKRQQTMYGRKVIGTCPWCGSPVIVGKTAYGCSAWKEKGCNFKIWIHPHGLLFENEEFTEKDATALLAGKAVKKSKLNSKKGTVFEAKVKLKNDGPNEYGANFELVFDDKRKSTRSKKKSSGKK